MSKEAVYVRVLGNHYLLIALVIHIYKNVLYWKFLLIGYVVSLYRFPSQTPDEFDSFNNNLEKLLIDMYYREADFVLMIGVFNAKSCNWSINDTTTLEGAQLDFITTLYGIKQFILEPTHILCIDLIFTNRGKLLIDMYYREADFVLMIGVFNVKSFNWSINDTTTLEGAQLDFITTLYGMKQLILEPTHILCIDLIFTNQSNIVMDSGVDSSLHSKCDHQIIYSKLTLKIEYPPSYIRKI